MSPANRDPAQGPAALASCAGLPAGSRRRDIPRHAAERTLDGFAIAIPGRAAPGYFPSRRQVEQREANLGKRNSRCGGNLRVELLAVLLQVLEDRRVMHLEDPW